MRRLQLGPAGVLLSAVALGGCGSDNVVAPSERVVLSSQVVTTAYNYTGNDFACALTIDGEAYCWGENDRGALGNGTREASLMPVKVATSVRFESITAGDDFACAKTADDEAYCWGSVFDARSGLGTDDEDRLVPAPLATELRFTQLSAADSHVCGVSTDGDAYCWGAPTYASLGDGNTRASRTPVRVPLDGRVLSISAAWELTCALMESGQAHCWGLAFPTDLGQLVSDAVTPVAEGFRFATFAAHGADFCGITTSTELYCWFGSDGGPPNEAAPTFLGRGFAKFSSGQPFCAIRPGGEATCWSVPRDFRFSFDQPAPNLSVRTFESLSFLSISGSLGWTCGVVQSGPEGAGVYCWGSNRWGQLGIGSTLASADPKRTLMPRR